MKKILFSIAGIVAVAALVVTSTGALFSDTETSTGNVFTAGAIDLKVDHLRQTYNGDDCETCSLSLWSGDGAAQVVGGTNTMITVFPYAAPLVIHTPITTQYWTTHSTAQWIWSSPSTLVGDDGTNGDVTYTFEHKFNWWGSAVNVDLLMDVAADNQYQILLNGTPIASGLGSAEYTTLDPVSEASFLAEVDPGQNTLTFIVTNKVNTPGNNTPLNNPGGLLYYLTVTRAQEDCDANSAFQRACRLWTEKDLTEGDTFYNFNDVKPGDSGTNLISLHPDSNDAYVCLFTHDLVDAENTHLAPEVAANDLTAGPLNNGELSQYLKMFAWDDDGDGAYEAGEATLVGPNVSLATGYANLPIVGGTTDYVGIAWCAGTQSVVGTTISCDGSGMSNVAQTDSSTMDVTAYAVQQRNNPNFSCEDIVADYRNPAPVVAPQ